MVAADDCDENAVAAAFLVELLRDRERGHAASLADYQSRYPGYEAVIAREYAELQGVGEPAEPNASTASGLLDDGERYRVEEEVGRGGMGAVFKAFESRLQRHLALKKVNSGASQQELARFLEEARVTAQLHHPGIVPVHDLGIDRTGRLFFTMDLVRGRTFAEVIAEQLDRGPNRGLEVLQRVCEAVAFAHDKGVVHRDLKPQNVMVGRFGEVYVMDWGLAHVAGATAPVAIGAGEHGVDESVVFSARNQADTPEWTMQGDVVGTPAYMAPEQALGGAVADARADVYAIGAMLYQLLTGSIPYVVSGANASSRIILERVVAGPPPALVDVRPDAPPELVAICEQAMARRPEDRYQDVLALRDDLRAFVEQRVVRAYERGAWAELKKWVQRNRAITVSAVAAVLALAIALVVSLVQTSRASAQAEKANKSFGDAVEAVEVMLSRVGQHKLDNVPQAVEVRRELLQDAVAFYEKLLSDRREDPLVRRRVARANYRVAVLHEELGERAAASTATARALQLRLAELEHSPDDRDLLRELGETYNQMGLQAANAGRYERADEAYLEGLQVVGRLLAIERLPRVVELAGVLHGNLGVTAYRRKLYQAAERSIRASLEHHLEAAELSADTDQSKVRAARVLLGAVLRANRDFRGAQREWQAAVEILERLVAERSGDFQIRKELSSALQNVAISMHDLKDTDAALRTMARSLQLRRDNVAEFPQLPICWAGLGSSLINQSQFARTGKQLPLALNAAREAVTSLQKALLMDPPNAAYRGSLYKAHRNLYRTARQLGDHAELARYAELFSNEPQADRKWRLEATHRLRVASGIAAKDAQLTKRQREEARQRYYEQCMQVLDRMASQGELSPEDLEHAVFAPIQETPAFVALRSKLADGR